MKTKMTARAGYTGTDSPTSGSGFLMAGLSWNETEREHYAAQSGDFKYELYRDTTGRWTGHVTYATALLASDRSCNSIATQADYLVSLCRYRLSSITVRTAVGARH